MTKQTWIIGSDHSCDLIVENKTVSGQHCRLSVDGSQLRLTDLRSTNGTYVNDVLLEGTRVITRVDRITLGKTQPMPWPDSLLPPGVNTTPKENQDHETRRVITIGRSPENSLVLNEGNVSSFHARIMISNGEIVIEDLGSTNGTSVGSVQNKIKRSVLQPDEKIFFGSREYQLADLLAKAPTHAEEETATTKTSQKPSSAGPSAPPAGPTGTKPSPMSQKGVLLGIAGGVLVVLVIIVTLIVNRGPQRTASNGSPTVDEETVDLPPPADSSSDVENSDVNDAAPANIEQTLSERIASGLFILVCTDPQRQTPMRIGTAFAIDAEHVATAASAILAMNSLKNNGFSEVMLYHPVSGNELKIVDSVVHPDYVSADAEARNAQQAYDQMMDNLELNPPEPDEFETVKEKLLSTRMTALKSLDRKTTYDVGIIEVAGGLSNWLSGVEPDASLRPKLKLNVMGYAFDVEDPYFDSTVSFDLSTMSSRIRTLSQASRKTPQRLLADGTTEQLEYTYLGSPALNSQGQVVALYSRPSPPSDESSNPEINQAFDAPLFERVRECLSLQP